jgi:hypothetical protein
VIPVRKPPSVAQTVECLQFYFRPFPKFPTFLPQIFDLYPKLPTFRCRLWITFYRSFKCLALSPNLRPFVPKFPTFKSFCHQLLRYVSPNFRPLFPKSSTFCVFLSRQIKRLRVLLTVVKKSICKQQHGPQISDLSARCLLLLLLFSLPHSRACEKHPGMSALGCLIATNVFR